MGTLTDTCVFTDTVNKASYDSYSTSEGTVVYIISLSSFPLSDLPIVEEWTSGGEALERHARSAAY